MAFEGLEKLLRQNVVEAVADVLRPRLVKELKDQGHIMTGALSKSIEFRLSATARNIVIEGLFLDYGLPLETGVPARNVPFSIPGRARTSKYIAGLIRFIRLRKINASPFAIARAHKKQGIPTKGSFRFSKNGRRTGWVSHTLDNPDGQNAIDDAIGKILGDLVQGPVLNEIIKTASK